MSAVSENIEPIHNLQNIVLNAIEDFREKGLSMKDYNWCLRILARFYQNKYRVTDSVMLVSREMAVDYQTRIWPFPSDYIRYTKIAYRYNGQLWTLGVDNSMDISNMPLPCDVPIEQAIAPPAGFPIGYAMAPIIGSLGFYSPMYASGGGFNVNYYRVNEEKGYIQFSENLPIGIAVVEYLSAGKGVNDYSLIPIEDEYGLDNYLKAQIAELKFGDIGLAQYYQQKYEMHVWTAKTIKYSPTFSELKDIIYRSSGFKIR